MNSQDHNSEIRGKITPKELRQGPIDNGEVVLREFWEKSQKRAEVAKPRDLTKRTIDLIKKAKDIIIIYTPKLTHPELMVELERSYQRGVRVYSLTARLKIHSEQFSFGIMRERRDITSTFIVIDPQRRAKGIWFVGELTSKSNPSLTLELDSDQAMEACAHFSHIFWNSSGQEIFFEKDKSIVKMVDSKPKIPAELANSLRYEGFESLANDEIRYLSIPLPLSESFEDYNLLARDLCVEMNEHAREILPGIDFEWTKLKAAQKLPFGYANLDHRGQERHLVFGWDLGFFLNAAQKGNILEAFPPGVWVFNKEKKLKNIRNEIFLEESNWNDPDGVRIKDHDLITLDDIQCDTIEEWLDNLPEPDFPLDIKLLRKIEYLWRLIPPYRPQESKKHRLYKQWDGFDKAFKKEIDRIIFKINQAQAKKKDLKIKKTRIITLTTKWRSLENELKQIGGGNWKYKQDTSDVKRALARIENLEVDFKESITAIKEKKSDSKGEEPNELSGLLGFDDSRNQKVKIPYDTLPTKGILYEKGNNCYLEISDIGSLEQAKAIAKRYHAKVVAERSD